MIVGIYDEWDMINNEMMINKRINVLWKMIEYDYILE